MASAAALTATADDKPGEAAHEPDAQQQETRAAFPISGTLSEPCPAIIATATESLSANRNSSCSALGGLFSAFDDCDADPPITACGGPPAGAD